MSAPIVQVVQLPRGEDAKRPDATAPRAFTGITVGPFFCHHVYSDDETVLMGRDSESLVGDWQVTHLSSGACVRRGIRSAFRAIWLAEKLSAFPGTHEPTIAAVVQATEHVKAHITVLLHEATHGDCSGICNFNYIGKGEP